MSNLAKVAFTVSLPFLFCLIAIDTGYAQGYHQFLGSPRRVPDQFSPKYGIRFNTQGFDDPSFDAIKKINKWQKKGVPDGVIQELLSYPGSFDSIGKWIDDAFDSVKKEFKGCGGELSQRAARVSSRPLSVMIMPSAFHEPYWKVDVAGAYYPSTKQIKVLNVYYIWRGSYKGWLRHARELIKWEMGNYFAVESGIQPEPRPAGWPCNAPRQK